MHDGAYIYLSVDESMQLSSWHDEYSYDDGVVSFLVTSTQ